MRTITTKVFQIDELDQPVYESVIEKHREALRGETYIFSENVEWEIDHNTKWELDKDGLQYSLSYSEENGLSFAGEREVTDDLKPDSIPKARWNLIKEHIRITSTGNIGNHYCYAHENDIIVELDHQNILLNLEQGIIEPIRLKMVTEYKELCDKFEKEGYEYFESTSTDKYIENEIKGNEYEFLFDGTLYQEDN